MSSSDTPKGEPQYEAMIEEMTRRGPERLGLMTSWAWLDDPKRLTFTLSRYKFVAKMLDGKARVLEVGCGDGFGARVVAQAVESLTCTDFDRRFLASAEATSDARFDIRFVEHDMLDGPFPGSFDALYSLDVLEHIPADREDLFLSHALAPLSRDGVAVIGMPSLESQAYASQFSRMGHVNCKTQPDFKRLMETYFVNVFMFSMNDEVIHTGYHKMSHYNLALCCGLRDAGAE